MFFLLMCVSTSSLVGGAGREAIFCPSVFAILLLTPGHLRSCCLSTCLLYSTQAIRSATGSVAHCVGAVVIQRQIQAHIHVHSYNVYMYMHVIYRYWHFQYIRVITISGPYHQCNCEPQRKMDHWHAVNWH